MKNNISFRVIGDIEKLPANVQQRLNTCVAHTSHNTGMCLVLALSYSSRWEITEAARQIADLVQKGELKPEQIDSELISRHLTTHFMPDPDLPDTYRRRAPASELHALAMRLFGTLFL